MRIAYDNLLSSSLATPSSEDSNYPISNLDTSILTTSFRTLSHDSESIVFDAGAGNTFDITTIAISGHNLTSSATITFQMDDDPAFGSPSTNITLTWRESHILRYVTDDKQYMKFIFDDPTNTDDFIEIGYLYAGEYTQITPSSNIPFKVTNIRNDVVFQTDQGASYGSPGVSHKIVQYDFDNVSDTMVETLRTVYGTVGKYQPIYLMNFDSLWTHFDIMFCRLMGDLEETINGNKKNSISLSFEECK